MSKPTIDPASADKRLEAALRVGLHMTSVDRRWTNDSTVGSSQIETQRDYEEQRLLVTQFGRESELIQARVERYPNPTALWSCIQTYDPSDSVTTSLRNATRGSLVDATILAGKYVRSRELEVLKGIAAKQGEYRNGGRTSGDLPGTYLAYAGILLMAGGAVLDLVSRSGVGGQCVGAGVALCVANYAVREVTVNIRITRHVASSTQPLVAEPEVVEDEDKTVGL